MLGVNFSKYIAPNERHLTVSFSTSVEPSSIRLMEMEKKNTGLPRLFLVVDPTRAASQERPQSSLSDRTTEPQSSHGRYCWKDHSEHVMNPGCEAEQLQ